MRQQAPLAARAHGRIANQRADFLHRLSTWLVNTYDIVVFEDLSLPALLHHPTLARAIYDASWGTLIRLTTYKAESARGRVVKVNPAYTSVECSRCHAKVPKTLAMRMHMCPECGLTIDRDVNSAKVIEQRGEAQVGPVQSEPNACGEGTSRAWYSMPQVSSQKQEAPSVRTG